MIESLDFQNAGSEHFAQTLRTLGQRLTRTEQLRDRELLAYQTSAAAKLLTHARETSDFYRNRLPATLPTMDANFWADIPILTRNEADANREKLKSRRTPPEAGPVVEGQTTGSTGTPLRFKTNVAVRIMTLALNQRMFRWWRVDGDKTLAMIFHDRTERSAPRCITSGGWHSAHPHGKSYSLSSDYELGALLDFLVDRRPQYFAAYPNVHRELATLARARRVGLQFELLFSFGGAVSEDTRELCRSTFQSEIADTYGCLEIGHIAAQCPDCGEYHISAENCFVEIIGDSGAPALPGETGRVIVTSLRNYAMPLIRYQLGDLAEVGTRSPACGRGLPTLRRILGRDRNIFRFRDGTRVYPTVRRFYQFLDAKQFQVVQTDFEHVEIRYVPEKSARPADLVGLTERLRGALHQQVNVTLRPVDAIERSPSGKYEDFVSLVAE